MARLERQCHRRCSHGEKRLDTAPDVVADRRGNRNEKPDACLVPPKIDVQRFYDAAGQRFN
jgi:hypothetical protein